MIDKNKLDINKILSSDRINKLSGTNYKIIPPTPKSKKLTQTPKKKSTRRTRLLYAKYKSKYKRAQEKKERLQSEYRNISKEINYKNLLLLSRYIKISGKIIPKRLNNLTTKQQRQISKAIKNARLMSFIPFFCGIRK